MESDYNYGSDVAGCEAKALDGLMSIADEADRAIELIGSFITRFRHGGPAPSTGVNKLAPVPAGHAGQIGRLRGAIEELSKLARELQTIG